MRAFAFLREQALGPVGFVRLPDRAVELFDRCADVLAGGKRVEVIVLDHDYSVRVLKPVKHCLTGKTLHLVRCQVLMLLHAAQDIFEARHEHCRIRVVFALLGHNSNDPRCGPIPFVIFALLAALQQKGGIACLGRHLACLSECSGSNREGCRVLK